HGALCKIPTGRHRLSDVAASGPIHQTRWSSGTDRLADEPRQRERLSGFDCARWHDVVRSARNDFVLRAGVQRRAAARLRLRLRAGDQSAGVAQAHARATERCAGDGCSQENAVIRVRGYGLREWSRKNFTIRSEVLGGYSWPPAWIHLIPGFAVLPPEREHPFPQEALSPATPSTPLAISMALF